MKSFRDFFYDRNDIFVAAVILLLAGLLIFTKIDAIMDYPHADTDTGKRVKKIENPDHSKKKYVCRPVRQKISLWNIYRFRGICGKYRLQSCKTRTVLFYGRFY